MKRIAIAVLLVVVLSLVLVLPAQAAVIENEKVQVLNLNNGERLETYVIKGKRGSGEICLNGAAARKVVVGDIVIIMSYAMLDYHEARTFKPTVVFPDSKTNKLI